MLCNTLCGDTCFRTRSTSLGQSRLARLNWGRYDFHKTGTRAINISQVTDKQRAAGAGTAQSRDRLGMHKKRGLAGLCYARELSSRLRPCDYTALTMASHCAQCDRAKKAADGGRRQTRGAQTVSVASLSAPFLRSTFPDVPHPLAQPNEPRIKPPAPSLLPHQSCAGHVARVQKPASR